MWRHPSGMGTVIEFNDGQDRKVLVLDAQYRKRTIITRDTTDTSLPNYGTANTNGTWYIDGGSSDTTPPACESLTDETLNSLWVNSIDVNTSRYNTDVWLTLLDSYAATYCRSLLVDGIGCDIPNIQTLMRIYCEGVNLDALDPTVNDYPKLALSDWFNRDSNTHSTNAITSSERSGTNNRQINYGGHCGSAQKGLLHAVLPILEL